MTYIGNTFEMFLAPKTLISQGFQAILSLPLNRCRRLGGDSQQHAGDVRHFIHNTAADVR